MAQRDPPTEAYDVIVVGAGPGGLTTAIYLARFRRRVLVLSAGPSRASWIPESHNTPGFSHGVGGVELLQRLAEQAAQFGADLREGRVASVTPTGEGFDLATGQGVLRARYVVLATGVLDRMPGLAGLEDAIRCSIVRMCPICDAYEAIGKRIAVLGGDGPGAREAAFLRGYSDDVTLLRVPADEPTSASPSPAAPSGEVIDVALSDLSLTDRGLRLNQPGKPARTFDHLYLALGCSVQSQLGGGCGAACDEIGNFIVDAHQQTTIPGLYAAGDVVRGLNQIAVAAGEAAIAATAIHNRLRER